MGLGTVAALIKGMTQKIEKELAQEKTAIQGLGLTVDNNGRLCMTYEEANENE